MPRDSLGRIVYVGDRLLALGEVDLIAGGKLIIGVSHGRFMVSPGRAAVDLEASPERTNYERYFADLGTRDEVVDAADSCLFDRSISCSGCPIDGWGAAFGLLRFLLRLAGRNGGGLMAEYVITDEEIVAVIRKAYEAGKAGREVYTVRDYLNRPLVRCRDCKHYYEHSEEDLVYCINRPILRGDKYVETEPYGYCAWGERRGGEPCR